MVQYKKLVRSQLFNYKFKLNICLLFLAIGAFFTGCKKLVEIAPPVDSITKAEIIETDAKASSAITGIYSQLVNTGAVAKFGNGAVTIFGGLSADELNFYFTDASPTNQLNINNIQNDNGLVLSQIWTPAYAIIYHANSCLEGLQSSPRVSLSIRNQLIGEAKFIRAFCYFYLVNFFGDVPLVMTTDWKMSSLLSKTAKKQVYQQIEDDLEESQSLLKNDYSISNNERIRANRWAATALLARVHLYQGNWVAAETLATSVINNTRLFGLNNNLDEVFLKNSREAILQLQPSNIANPYINTEPFYSWPFYLLTNEQLSSFDEGDLRRVHWVDSTSIGAGFYYPFKYKIRTGTVGDDITEYYMVLRLAEQYLIRAEARVRLNMISEAKSDLDIVRSRANLGPTPAMDELSLLAAIQHERQVELFAEWGHRWLDLKRWGIADSVLSVVKGANWQTTDQLYPIPLSEILKNRNLTQNDGYN